MKVLVTGGCGFIGTNLLRKLIGCNETVINVDRLTYAANASVLAELAGSSLYKHVNLDICDQEALQDLFSECQPDAVMHLAAESHVDRSIDNPHIFMQTNLFGTFSLLQASLEYWQNASDELKDSFRFLHVSTDEVYGSLGPDSPPFLETNAYEPKSPYAATKAGADHLVRAWASTYGLPVLVTNCSNNYGPYQFPEKLIPVVILKCLRWEQIPVYGAGENIRDWLYVGDHVDALYQVLRSGRVGETYNIGGNNEQRNIDLVRAICRLIDHLKPSTKGSYEELITFVPDRPGHDMRYAMDTNKITSELGWTPKEDFESGLRKTVEWYLENEDWWQSTCNGDI